MVGMFLSVKLQQWRANNVQEIKIERLARALEYCCREKNLPQYHESNYDAVDEHISWIFISKHRRDAFEPPFK